MSDELKPCPFCGSSYVEEDKDEGNWPIVMCSDCGARGPCIELDRSKVNSLWNTRSITEVLPDDANTLRKMLFP